MAKYAIYGAGSLGTVLGAYITKNGGEIDLINRNRAHVTALNEKGAKITGTVEMTVPVKAITHERTFFAVSVSCRNSRLAISITKKTSVLFRIAPFTAVV